MINKTEDLSFITDEDGKETPIQVLDEFDNPKNGKRFVIYTDIEDPKDDEEERQFYVAEVATMDDGSQELREVEDENDMAYCQEVFDDIVEKMMSQSLSDEETFDEDDDEPTIVS